VKKYVFLLLIVLSSSLFGCENIFNDEIVTLEYSLEELIPTMEGEEISVDEGLLHSDLIDNEFYVGVYTNEFQEQGTTYTYKRYISPRREFLIHLNDVSELIYENFDLISDIFEDPNDIGHIVINNDLGILSILPKDTSSLTTKNSVVLSLPEEYIIFDDEYDTWHDEFTVNYENATGFNFRDIIISQFNIEYSAESMDTLEFYSWIVFTWLENEFTFIDVVIEKTSESENTRYLYIDSDASRLLIGHQGSKGNFTSNEIPLIIERVYGDKVYPTDYLLKTNTDKTDNSISVIFYQTR
jgi:hypothetical protein